MAEKAREAQESDGLPARRAALALIESVLVSKKPLDDGLEGEGAYRALDGKDRAFARMLASTVFRRKGQMDIALARLTDGRAIAPDMLRHILYIGMAQIAFMDVADHAAVDTSVRLAEQSGLARQKGFVNAVLRRVVREPGVIDSPVSCNIPAWILQQWVQGYGHDIAERMAESSMAEAPLDLTLKNPQDARAWAQKLNATLLPTGTLRQDSARNVAQLPGFADGEWWVQDSSAALPVRLFGDLTGKTVMDLCAAPGGKTMQLAGAGAHVIALDRSESRLKRVHENLARTNLSDRVQVVVADATLWRPDSPVDAVLLDAPCTATGTIRRHPDLLPLKSEKDLAQLVALQARLLDAAAAMLKPGGMLVYCTCSLQPAEGEGQTAAFLARHPDFKVDPIGAADIPGAEDFITGDGYLRLLPFHLGGTDGFFAARFIKLS